MNFVDLFRSRSAPSTETPPTTALPEPVFDIDCLLRYEVMQPAHFVFQLHALQGPDQRVISEALHCEPALSCHVFNNPAGRADRFIRVDAEPGPLALRYRARVAIGDRRADPQAGEQPVARLPDDLVHHLLPTRYCESDLLANAAAQMFGQVPPGHQRVQAITDWVHEHIAYTLGSSDATTTARDVFVRRQGVCRDLAHLAITFCRALNIPARLVVGYAIFDEPPPDFHAVFEAYIGDRWVLFDPTRMSPVEHLVRIAAGRDAKDVAFATIFGAARMLEMAPQIERVI